MKNKIIVPVSMLFIFLILFTVFAEKTADPNSNESEITVRRIEAQTVLYTIFRGDYKNVGPVIGRLYAIAGKNGIRPTGSPSCVYLNNPKLVSSEHWLTEIRIPVSEDALKLSGTLGEMTDIKKIPSVTMAVVIKPEGMADAAPVYEKLHKWMLQEKSIMTDSACEIMLTNSMSGDYSQMKSEIMVPVVKIDSPK